LSLEKESFPEKVASTKTVSINKRLKILYQVSSMEFPPQEALAAWAP
jgi:hypothetical protein